MLFCGRPNCLRRVLLKFLPSLNLDLKQAVQELIETNSELSSLYRKLGYSAELDRNSGQLLREMKELIRTEIPDFTAFKLALRAAQEQADKQPIGEFGDPAIRKDQISNRKPCFVERGPGCGR